MVNEAEQRCDILLVDGSKQVLQSIRLRFEDTKYKFYTAPNGRAALNLLASEIEFKLVILDYNMDEMDGVETIQILRRLHKTIPVIVHTSHKAGGQLMMDWGGDYWFTKPNTGNETLNSVVERLLEYQTALETHLECAQESKETLEQAMSDIISTSRASKHMQKHYPSHIQYSEVIIRKIKETVVCVEDYLSMFNEGVFPFAEETH